MGPFKIGRFALADELPKLFKEANVLYWAKSLLQFTYKFIDGCLASASDPGPPCIPRLRFVEAGLAFSYSQGLPLQLGGSGPRQGQLVQVSCLKNLSPTEIDFVH